MSKLLDKYRELGMLRADENLDEKEEQKIIETAPVYMRPMIKMQKEKHLK